MSKKVAVIMGSDSDFPVVKGCIKTLKSFGIETEVRVLSAHRTPAEASAVADSARERGYGVRIAAAGTLVTPGGAMEILALLGREEALRRALAEMAGSLEFSVEPWPLDRA